MTDEEVQTEIDTILQHTFGGDQAQFDEALKAQNMTVEQLKVNYKESMLLQKAYEEVTKDITTVPDADIAAYYEENKADYFVDETRTARHILISPSAKDDSSTTSTTAAGDTTTTTAAPTEADWEAALAEAEEVRQELVDGGDWTALAAEYSDDPGSKEVGGELGVVSKGQMVPEFDESVFSLAKDEISQPIKTSYGYHIIQVTDITEAKQYTLDEVKEDISSNLVNEKKGEVWQEWLDSIRAKLGVIFKAGMEPTTTTTAATTETTRRAAPPPPTHLRPQRAKPPRPPRPAPPSLPQRRRAQVVLHTRTSLTGGGAAERPLRPRFVLAAGGRSTQIGMPGGRSAT